MLKFPFCGLWLAFIATTILLLHVDFSVSWYVCITCELFIVVQVCLQLLIHFRVVLDSTIGLEFNLLPADFIICKSSYNWASISSNFKAVCYFNDNL